MKRPLIADLSHSRGAVDWLQAREQLDMVILRASKGNIRDTRYLSYAQDCGLPYGTYHYVRAATADEARKEARFFVECANEAKPLFYIADIENKAQTEANTEEVCVAFLDELRALGCKRVGLYINKRYKWAGKAVAMCDIMWIPRWGKDDGEIPAEKYAPDHPCDLWQFTSNGRIAGISKNVDLSILYGDKTLEWFTDNDVMGGITMNAPDRVCETAEAELGYLEKKSNKDLDDKTANAGSRNYTKYNRDMKAWAGSASLNDQWCQNFVDWCFVSAFGLDVAKKLIYTFTNYTPTGSNAFKKRGRYIKRGKGKPRRGDVIYFYSTAKGRIGHVGIVTKVTDSKVYTIEGNTSGASTLVTNGGGVRKKSYSLSSTYIDGYGQVDYSVVGDMDAAPTPAPTLKLGDRLLTNGCEGEDVKALQSALISLGYSCGEYGADGEFGDCTEMAVRMFQINHSDEMDADGEYGPQTHVVLMAILEAKPASRDPESAQFVEIEPGKKCYIRAANSTTAEILGVAYSGQRLPYQGETFENGWHLVMYHNRNACVSGKYGKLV